MGLPDSYRLPERATDAYHLLGDGVVAPVVRRSRRGAFGAHSLGQLARRALAAHA